MKKVLVIEDNEDNMSLITFILQKGGYNTIWAENGRKGVELAEREKPHFIILDIQLPDIDGFEVLRQIRASKADARVPIIAMTSYAMSGDREKLMKAGCTGYIEKPIDPETVMEEIHKIIKKNSDILTSGF
ncbi:MAG: two-component system response regulator [Nitrospirae bacterium GWC2_42_7]|nr:MAG: two-component system response regulator [Nitrospirae bacterium GWC2_42_7]